MYRQLASVLEQQFGHQYPDLVISGENYNPGSFRLEISQVLGMVKMIIIAMVVFNFNPWVYMELGPTPSYVSWALENKIYACLMTFFLINAVETQLISSGAFEVTVNGEKVWSKLESGGAPQPVTLVNLIREKLKQQSNRISDQVEMDLRDQL